LLLQNQLARAQKDLQASQRDSAKQQKVPMPAHVPPCLTPVPPLPSLQESTRVQREKEQAATRLAELEHTLKHTEAKLEAATIALSRGVRTNVKPRMSVRRAHDGDTLAATLEELEAHLIYAHIWTCRREGGRRCLAAVVWEMHHPPPPPPPHPTGLEAQYDKIEELEDRLSGAVVYGTGEALKTFNAEVRESSVPTPWGAAVVLTPCPCPRRKPWPKPKPRTSICRSSSALASRTWGESCCST
jgi:hypothetical protein